MWSMSVDKCNCFIPKSSAISLAWSKFLTVLQCVHNSHSTYSIQVDPHNTVNNIAKSAKIQYIWLSWPEYLAICSLPTHQMWYLFFIIIFNAEGFFSLENFGYCRRLMPGPFSGSPILFCTLLFLFPSGSDRSWKTMTIIFL